MLKGALHSHTTRSDGRLTPEEVMRLHSDNGYDFIAITDHRRYNYIDYAPELGLTLLPGMEFDNGVSIPCEHGFRCFHTVCVGPHKEDGNGFEQDVLLDSANAPTQEAYQPYLDEIHAKNNLTIYCHPEWSSTPARYFEKLQGNFAMEVWNSGCAIEDDMDTDASYWDELLGQNIRILGVATDDGHTAYQHCKGWVMVNAENNVPSILQALKDGAFYSSCGPEFFDMYVENGKLIIDCSPVQKIRLHSDCHPTRILRNADGTPLTHGEFDTAGYGYVRVTIIDKENKYAWTNPIFLD